jgi:hypothetical protein
MQGKPTKPVTYENDACQSWFVAEKPLPFPKLLLHAPARLSDSWLSNGMALLPLHASHISLKQDKPWVFHQGPACSRTCTTPPLKDKRRYPTIRQRLRNSSSHLIFVFSASSGAGAVAHLISTEPCLWTFGVDPRPPCVR